MLCETWEGDGITFRFHIKQGVTFWSGEKLTADDVVYSLRAAKANEASPYYSRMADVKSIYADDENTVGVVLKSANMDFPRLMDIPVFRQARKRMRFPMAQVHTSQTATTAPGGCHHIPAGTAARWARLSESTW